MFNKFVGLPEFVINISSNLLMKVNKSGSVLFINDKAKCVFNEIVSNKSLKLSVQAKDWIVLNNNIEIALYNQYPHHFYWEYKGRFYIVYIYPEDAFLWLYFEDVTEKKHLSHLLYINSLRNNFWEKHSKSGYWELDVSNKRFYWSSGVYRLFEMEDNNSSIGRKNLIRELIFPQDMFLYKSELKKLLKYKKDIGGFVRILTKKNKIKKCRFGAGIIYENGEEKIAGVFVDVSDCESQNCKKCMYLSENFSCMLAKVVHDLRQPISAMGIVAKNLEENLVGDNRLLASRIGEICDNLNSMINGTLNFAKEGEQKAERFDLSAVIVKVCDEYHDKMKKKGLKVILKLNNYEVCQNLFLVEKIIRNLIDNALKFAKTKILVKNIKNCFFVIDDGIGIDKEQQKHVFDDFFQSEISTCNRLDGVGLGLGIVNYSALLIDAKIKLKSRKNGYTIFKVCL